MVASNHQGTLSDQYYKEHTPLGLIGQKDDAAYYANGSQQTWTDTYQYSDGFQQQLTHWGVVFEQTGGSATELDIHWTHDYVYDPLGNTRKRTVTVADNKPTPQATTATQTYQYDELGNPHRLTNVTQNGRNRAYNYDNNGSITADGDKTFQYYSWNKVKRITKDSNTTDFEYNPDRSRTLRVDTQDGKTTETLYVGGSYERVSSENSTEHRYTIGGTTLITQTENANTETTRHLVTDYQGSTIAITNANGDIEQRFRYTPYGEQVDVSVGLTRDKGIHSLTTMGYTGHEHIEGMDVVHMNGRIYDPTIGRMLQVDPLVQAPNFVLSYNRYAYVWNNPVNMIDPSGYKSYNVTDSDDNPITTSDGTFVTAGHDPEIEGGDEIIGKVPDFLEGTWLGNALHGLNQFNANYIAGQNVKAGRPIDSNIPGRYIRSEWKQSQEVIAGLQLVMNGDVPPEILKKGAQTKPVETRIEYISIMRFWVKGDDGLTNLFGKEASNMLLEYFKSGRLKPSPSMLFDIGKHHFVDKTKWSLYEVKINMARDYEYKKEYYLDIDNRLSVNEGWYPNTSNAYEHSIYQAPTLVKTEDFKNMSSGPLPKSYEFDREYPKR